MWRFAAKIDALPVSPTASHRDRSMTTGIVFDG